MKKCKKTILYSYINSGNHGCEAIARSTYDILEMKENENYLFTTDMPKDIQMKLDEQWKLMPVPTIHGLMPISSLIPRVLRKALIDPNALWKYQYKNLETLFDANTLAISSGGDIYCYDGSDWLTYLNYVASSRGAKTILWGCSIESNRINNRVLDDLKAYDLITVRESYTQKNLKEKGICNNVRYFPDPAFLLKSEPIDIWNWDKMGKIIGINLSTYVVKSKKIYETFCEFIRNILDNTEYSIVLIPHVFWGHEDDLKLLSHLYKDLSPNDKLYLVNQEYNCMQLKYIISKCNFYIGARTHSVIAAYSSYVPALALSYSLKSRGIAYDLFGEENHYVLSVSDNITTEKLLSYMSFLVKQQEDIINRLKTVIPQYEDMLKKEIETVEMLF